MERVSSPPLDLKGRPSGEARREGFDRSRFERSIPYPADVYPHRRAGEAAAPARGVTQVMTGPFFQTLPGGPTVWRHRRCFDRTYPLRLNVPKSNTIPALRESERDAERSERRRWPSAPFITSMFVPLQQYPSEQRLNLDHCKPIAISEQLPIVPAQVGTQRRRATLTHTPLAVKTTVTAVTRMSRSPALFPQILRMIPSYQHELIR